jgi:hypothetical protein
MGRIRWLSVWILTVTLLILIWSDNAAWQDEHIRRERAETSNANLVVSLANARATVNVYEPHHCLYYGYGSEC